MKFSELSNKDRYRIIRMGVQNGIHSVSDIEHIFDEGGDLNSNKQKLNLELENKRDNTDIKLQLAKPKELEETPIYENPLYRYAGLSAFEVAKKENKDDIDLLNATTKMKNNVYINEKYFDNEEDKSLNVIEKFLRDEQLRNKLEGVNSAIDYFNSEGFKKRAHLMPEYNNVDIDKLLPSTFYIGRNDDDRDPYNNFNYGSDILDFAYLDPNKNRRYRDEYLNSYFDDYSTGAHETAHANNVYNSYKDVPDVDGLYKNDYSNLSKQTIDILKPSIRVNKHDSEISENYSDLVGLRVMMNKYKIFNSNNPSNIFNEKDYEKLIKDKRFKDNRFLQTHTKQQIIDAINLIAENKDKDKNKNINYA